MKDPERFGVVEFDEKGNAVSIEEKPEHPKSEYCVTGLYFYNAEVCEKSDTLRPSGRGELEITDLNKLYLEEGNLKVQRLDETVKWWDTGTFDSIMEAAVFVQHHSMENGETICSPEAIAYSNGWISRGKLKEISERYSKTSYGKYLGKLLGE